MPAAVRIALLLVVVATLPFLPDLALLTLALTIPMVAALSSPALRRRLVTGLFRIRWLLLAILVLYLVMDLRIVEALARCAVLVCAVAAVQVALYGLSPERLAEGLAFFVPAVFARRLAMTLEAVPEVQSIIESTKAGQDGTPLGRLADRAASVIRAIEAR